MRSRMSNCSLTMSLTDFLAMVTVGHRSDPGLNRVPITDLPTVCFAWCAS